MKNIFIRFNNPWILFFVFLTTNTLLSFFPLTTTTKLWIGIIGLAFPFGMALTYHRTKSSSQKLFWEREFLPQIPIWVWFLLGITAIFVRFYKLTTLSVWPHYDEGVYGYYAIQLDQKWNWRLFYGDSRVPPAYIWALCLWFKFFGTSLSTLWALPAFISTLVIPTAYAAARSFFSRSLSFLLVFLVSLSFWPLLLGRFSFMTGMVFLAECIAFYLFGKFLHANSLETKKYWAFALGSCLGLGFFIHIHWPIVVVLFLGSLFFVSKSSWKNSVKVMPYWASPFLVIAIPFITFAIKQGYGSYLAHLLAFRQTPSWLDQLSISLSCFSALVWGMDTHFHTYQPVWGGFLNPVLAALFFIGILELLQNLSRPFYLWLMVAFGLFLLPGVLTSDLETFRMVPLIPILLVIVVLGWQKSVATFAKRKAVLLSILIFIPSVCLDSFHLFGAYHHLWDSSDAWRGYVKSVERYRAYELLKQNALEKGSGLIFFDFIQGLPDQTLDVAVYDFNAAQNPKLSFEEARWVGVLANVNYQPFLAKRFPDGIYAWLSKDRNVPDGGLMLWMMPLNSSRLQEMEKWRKASLALKPFLDANIGYFEGRTYRESLKALEDAAPSFQEDAFLESCFWEKTADIYFKDYSANPGLRDNSETIFALNNAIQRGYQAAHLFEHLGIFYLMEKDKKMAKETFKKALKSPMNHTDAAQYLKTL